MCRICGDPQTVGLYAWHDPDDGRKVGSLCQACAKMQGRKGKLIAGLPPAKP